MTWRSWNRQKQGTLFRNFHWWLKLRQQSCKVFIHLKPLPYIRYWNFPIRHLLCRRVNDLCALFDVFSRMSFLLRDLCPSFNERYDHYWNLILINRSTTIKVINAKYEPNFVIVICKWHYCHDCNDLIEALYNLLLFRFITPSRCFEKVEELKPTFTLTVLLLSVVFKLCQIPKNEVSICLIEPEEFPEFILIDE